MPHLHRDRPARSCHICSFASNAYCGSLCCAGADRGLERRPGVAVHPSYDSSVFLGMNSLTINILCVGLTLATPAPGLGSPMSDICSGTGLAPAFALARALCSIHAPWCAAQLSPVRVGASSAGHSHALTRVHTSCMRTCLQVCAWTLTCLCGIDTGTCTGLAHWHSCRLTQHARSPRVENPV